MKPLNEMTPNEVAQRAAEITHPHCLGTYDCMAPQEPEIYIPIMINDMRTLGTHINYLEHRLHAMTVELARMYAEEMMDNPNMKPREVGDKVELT